MFRSATTRIAHKNAAFASLGIPGTNKDLRALQDLITLEKNIIQSLQKLSADYDKAAEALRAWGASEGEDLADVLNGSQILISHYSNALSNLVVHEEAVRGHMKAVRTREEALDELRRRRRSLGSQADSAEKKLAKMGSEHKNLLVQTDQLNRLHSEIRALDSEIMSEEARVGDFKRDTTREWMILKFGGLSEMGAKGMLVGDFGKMLIQEIPHDVTQPGLPRVAYTGGPHVQQVLMDANDRMLQIAFSPLPPMEVTQIPNAPGMPPRSPQEMYMKSSPTRMEVPNGDYKGPSPMYDSAPTLAPLGRAPSLSMGSFMAPSEASFAPTNVSSQPGATENSSIYRPTELGSDSIRRLSLIMSDPQRQPSIDEFGNVAPQGPPSHLRAGASYDSGSDSSPLSAQTLGSKGPIGGPRPGARFATFPIKGARPRMDSGSAGATEDHSPLRAEEISGQGRSPSSFNIPPPPTFPPGQAPSHITQPSVSSISSNSLQDLPPLPPSTQDSSTQLPPSGLPNPYATAERRLPSLDLHSANGHTSDFSSAIAAALAGESAGNASRSPYNAPARGALPTSQLGQPSPYSPVSFNAPTYQSPSPNYQSTYQPTTYEPTSFEQPPPRSPPSHGLPPGAAPPSTVSPPNKNYELASPTSVAPPPMLPSLSAIAEDDIPAPAKSPTSPQRKTWDAVQPTDLSSTSTLQLKPTMPPLIERPTDESMVTITTPRPLPESPTKPLTAPLRVAVPAYAPGTPEEESELSYMSPSRNSRVDPDHDGQSASEAESAGKGDRRVRFGAVTVSEDERGAREDEDDEDEDWMREADEDHDEMTRSVKNRPNSAFIRPTQAMMDEDDEDEQGSQGPATPRAPEWSRPPEPPVQAARAPSPIPPPPPPQQQPRAPTPPQDEHSLNAAAARDIAQELAQINLAGLPPPPKAPPPPPTETKAPSPTTSPSSQRRPSFDNSTAVSPPPRNRSPLPPPPSISLPRPSFSTNSSVASFSTPPEYPTASPLNITKNASRSNLSLTSPAVSPGPPASPTYPTGGGKISAAAFRKTQGARNASIDVGAKRSLPSSPYPNRAQSPPAPVVAPTAPLAVPGAGHGGEGSRPYSTYSTAGSDFENDYISSYMSSSPNDPDERRLSGYEAGKFATQTDNNGIR